MRKRPYLQIDCNPATVQKALKVLEKRGLIVSQGGKGYFVIESKPKTIELQKSAFRKNNENII